MEYGREFRGMDCSLHQRWWSTKAKARPTSSCELVAGAASLPTQHIKSEKHRDTQNQKMRMMPTERNRDIWPAMHLTPRLQKTQYGPAYDVFFQWLETGLEHAQKKRLHIRRLQMPVQQTYLHLVNITFKLMVSAFPSACYRNAKHVLRMLNVIALEWSINGGERTRIQLKQSYIECPWEKIN